MGLMRCGARPRCVERMRLTITRPPSVRIPVSLSPVAVPIRVMSFVRGVVEVEGARAGAAERLNGVDGSWPLMMRYTFSSTEKFVLYKVNQQ